LSKTFRHNSIPENKQNEPSRVEIQERNAVPQVAREKKRLFPFLTGAVVLIALAGIGVETRFSITPPTQRHSNKAAEMTVAVVHPQKASITIPRDGAT
jgi:hypothetical protein